MGKTVRWGIVSLMTAVLLGLPAGGALAHKGKLPEDALTLVRQASALLAQNPGMTGEVRERLQAALKSKKPAGVHLDQVAEALRVLDKKDVGTARRLLLAAIMPAGMPMPPEGPRGTAPKAVATPPSAAPLPSPPPAGASGQPPVVQLSVEVAMKMAEPLQARFTGSKAENAILASGLALVGLGLFLLGRTRRAMQP